MKLEKGKPVQQIQCIRAAYKQAHKLSLSDRHSNAYTCMSGQTYYRPSFMNAILSKDGTYDCRNLSGKVSCFEKSLEGKWRFVEHM